MIKIEKIQLAFKLMTQISGKNWVLIPKMAKTLKVDELELMDFMNNNPGLFHLETIFSYKSIRVGPKNLARSCIQVEKVKDKNLGLGIKQVYLTLEDNYRTHEWLRKQMKEKEKYLWIDEDNNYGCIQGYYLNVDTEAYLWRNTPEKLAWLADNGYTRPGSTTMGGFGDSYIVKHEHTITPEDIQKLRDQGWTFNEFKPLSK